MPAVRTSETSMFRSRKNRSRDADVVPEGDIPAEFDEETLVIVDRAVDPHAVMFHDPVGYRAEQFRGLRNKLVAMNPDDEPKTLVVTSAIKGEGKTVCAVNLAMAFAELEQHKVLLVDADLRAPRVEQALHLNPAPGLADVLLGRVGLDDSIRSSGVANLDVLGPGSRLNGPSELLASNRVAQLLEQLRGLYQYVILDTPPVLAATDASMLAARADGCLVTVRLEHSGQRPTREAIRTLEDLGGNVLGCFVTDVRGGDPDRDPRLSYARPADDEGTTWGA